MNPSVRRVLQWAAKKFPASKIQQDVIDAYAEELGHLDSARLELAFKDLIGKNEYWPSVAKILEAERHLVSGDSDAQKFRQLELALIQLNDERRGGVITQDQYIARYRATLEASGFTGEQLEQAPVYAPDKSGHTPERDLTWEKLRWRRRSREPADEGT